MRLAVLADIHSNLPALEAVLADADRHDVQGYLVAGDHFTGGPFPAETARLLRSLNAYTIRGNRVLMRDLGLGLGQAEHNNDIAGNHDMYLYRVD